MIRLAHDPRFRFLVALGGWSVALLAILRSPAGQRALVAPFTAWHARFASGFSGGSPVVVDLSCSGSDVIAVSIAAILAYPVAWRRRLTGVCLAVVWLGALNLLRVMSLVTSVGTSLFVPLHTYIWPALMIAGSMAFVFAWVFVDRSRDVPGDVDFARRRNFVAVTVLLSIAYVATAPTLLGSAALTRAAMSLASGAAAALRTIGVEAFVGGGTLVVGQQAYLVTPECIVTPLMPIYLGWAITWPTRLRSRLATVAMFVPVFTLLSELRLLTVALPGLVGPPLFLTHGFYQFVVAALLIVLAAYWRQPSARLRFRSTVYGLVTAAGVALIVGAPYTSLVDSAAQLLSTAPPPRWFGVPPPPDVQGATAIMPAFQLSLLGALCVACFASRSFLILTVLIPVGTLLQVATLVAVRELGEGLGGEVPVTTVRALSLAIPAALVAIAAAVDRRGIPSRRVLAGSHA